jgi:hypothetical protein
VRLDDDVRYFELGLGGFPDVSQGLDERRDDRGVDSPPFLVEQAPPVQREVVCADGLGPARDGDPQCVAVVGSDELLHVPPGGALVEGGDALAPVADDPVQLGQKLAAPAPESPPDSRGVLGSGVRATLPRQTSHGLTGTSNSTAFDDQHALSIPPFASAVGDRQVMTTLRDLHKRRPREARRVLLGRSERRRRLRAEASFHREAAAFPHRA